MTDPDERIINRAISYVGDAAGHEIGEVQDIREEARAALHRLFRDRRRLEKAYATAQNALLETQAENARLREENESLSWRVGEQANELAGLRGELITSGNDKEYQEQHWRAENARLREASTKDRQTILLQNAELARLREDRDKWKAHQERTKELKQQAEAELARLREFSKAKGEVIEGYQRGVARLREDYAGYKKQTEAAWARHQDEVARLREEKFTAQAAAKKAWDDIDRLREALRMLYDATGRPMSDDEAWLPALEVARDALKETT